MTDFTRRTHIVRCADPKEGDNPSTFIDYEVLDAVGFRIENNKEVILSTDAKRASPLIIDNTGGEHGVDNGNPTRKSHMERVVGKDDSTQKLDVEVIDIAAFRDQNNDEWILKFDSAGSFYNTTDNTGSSKSTRRTHNEKKSNDLTDRNPKDFLTVERCDTMAFRGPNNKEVILKCPSNDDLTNTDPRASTYIWSPQGYDPTDDSDSAVKPPLNKDPNLYCQMVKDAGGFLTGTEKISQGPLWWIRKVKTGGDLLVLSFGSSDDSSTQGGWIDACRLVTPDGEEHAIFTDINSIGSGASALLKTLPSKIFTADSTKTLHGSAQFSNVVLGFDFKFQTIFINLGGYSGDKDGNKKFSVKFPPAPRVVKTHTSLVAWSSVTPSAPTAFTQTIYGVTVFDQAAATTYMLANGPDLMSGTIWDNEAQAAAYAVTHTSHPYTLTTMVTDLIATGASVGCVVDTYSKKSIGGPKDLGNQNGPDTVPGEFTFPLYSPMLKSNGHETDHAENFLYSDPDWAIGYYSATSPWPSARWQDYGVSSSFDAALATVPAVTLNFEVVPGDKTDPTIPASRIHGLPSS